MNLGGIREEDWGKDESKYTVLRTQHKIASQIHTLTPQKKKKKEKGDQTATKRCRKLKCKSDTAYHPNLKYPSGNVAQY